MLLRTIYILPLRTILRPSAIPSTNHIRKPRHRKMCIPADLFTDADSARILTFWFKDCPDHPTMEFAQRWFQADAAFDSTCGEFLPLINTLSTCSPSIIHALATTPERTLSLLLLLDQFPRNIHRADSTSVYTITDPLALSLAEYATAPSRRHDLGPDQQWKSLPTRRCWFYLPFEHSESLPAHAHAGALQEELQSHCAGLEGEKTAVGIAKFHKEHTEVLEKFGRYPYRNSALGRPNTEAEDEWMKNGGVAWAR